MHRNDPNSATSFLRNIMHDRTAAIEHRVQAAIALLAVEGPDGPPKPSLTIQIQCISDDDMHTASWWSQWVAFCLEQQAYFHTLPPAEQDEIRRAVQRLERCNELDVGDVKFMSIKGHG
jgi:hypothetical protein